MSDDMVIFCTSAVFSQNMRCLGRGGSVSAAMCQMERFVIIVYGLKLPAVKYYHKALPLGCCSSPRSASSWEINVPLISKNIMKAYIVSTSVSKLWLPLKFAYFIDSIYMGSKVCVLGLCW